MEFNNNIYRSLEYNQQISYEIKRLTEPLLNNFGITTFAYTKFIGNKMFRISNNHEWTKFHLHNGYFDLDHYQKHIQQMGNNTSYVVLWDNHYNSNLIQAMRNHKVYYGLSIYKKFENYIELCSFATDNSNQQILNFYLNNIHLLERFIVYFKNKASGLIDLSDKNKLIIRKKEIIVNHQLPANDSVKDFLDMTTLNNFKTNNNIDLKISKRQSLCLFLITQGKTVKEIGRLLDISPRTVEHYINQLKYQLGCHSKNELINYLSDDFISHFQSEYDNLYK